MSTTTGDLTAISSIKKVQLPETSVLTKATQPPLDHPPSSSINVDLVIVFKPNLSKANASSIEKEYNSLLETLHRIGLQATGRPGNKNSNEILVCVKCPEPLLKSEVEAERLSDWLHGVCSTRPDPRTTRDFLEDPVTPAERVRLCYQLVTGTNESAPGSPSKSRAGITPQKAPFPSVISIFPPHDPEFNQQWIKSWTSWNHILSIPKQELVNIKNHFGEGVALYYEFLRSYFLALLVPTCLGLATWLSNDQFSIPYSVCLILWALFFTESWKLRERSLSIAWGTHGCHAVGTRRADFKPDGQTVDPFTNTKLGSYTWWKRDTKLLTNLLAVTLFAALLAGIITSSYAIEVFITEVYNGPGKRYLTLVPTVLFAGIVPQIVGIWQKLAHNLTTWENHAYEDNFEKSLTLKMFTINALVAYGGLTLTGYVYIPFGNLIIPHITDFFGRIIEVPSDHKVHPNAFNVNASRMRNTLVALATTSQVVNAFTEVGVPLLTRALFKGAAVVQEKRKRNSLEVEVSIDEEDEHLFLEQIRHESTLSESSLFTEYGEMVTQFGFVVLWSIIWPLVPVAAFINNFFELRSDAFKMTVNQRRPIPIRTDSIGPWLQAINALSWLSALTNPSLIYLFRPQSDHQCSSVASTVHNALNSTAAALNLTSLTSKPLGPQELAFLTCRVHQAATHSVNPGLALREKMFDALLLALCCEHLYALAGALLQYVLERAIWKNSPECEALQNANAQLKRQYMESMNIKVDDHIKELTVSPRTSSNPDPFWGREDAGLNELKRQLKTE